MCIILVLGDPSIETTATHLPSGSPSNEVIQVSTPSFEFIVEIPRNKSLPDAPFKSKAGARRTAWVALRDIGPKVMGIDPESGAFAMECLDGHTLTVDVLKSRLPAVVRLLRKIHMAEPAKWMWRYDPMAAVATQLEAVRKSNTMDLNDMVLIDKIVCDTAETVNGHPWVLCHNDFHSQNVFLQPARTRCCSGEKLIAIEFEECDLGDPMWDHAYLVVNLEMERDPEQLEILYDINLEERSRLRAYLPLPLARCATWTIMENLGLSINGKVLMERLGQLTGYLSRPKSTDTVGGPTNVPGWAPYHQPLE